MIRRILLKIKYVLRIPYSKSDNEFLLVNQMKKTAVFSEVETKMRSLGFVYDNRAKVYARLHPHSDAMVLNQVLIGEEYKPVTDYCKNNFKEGDHITIVDAGANVGYTSLYFLTHLSNVSIACIEPDNGNVAMLNKNLHAFIGNGTVKVFQNGLMGAADKNIVVQSSFRDGKDWSKNVMETNDNSELKSITVQQVMEQMHWKEIDILKIDIEGAERFVFSDESNLSFLENVKLLALEIHDEFNIRGSIYEYVKRYNFCILNFGETMIAINKRFL